MGVGLEDGTSVSSNGIGEEDESDKIRLLSPVDPGNESRATGGVYLRQEVSLSRALEEIGYGRYQMYLLCFAGATQLADATELITISFLTRELRGDWNLSQTEAALLQLSVLFGMGVGAVSCGILSDRFGRRTGSAFAVMFTALFGVASSMAVGLWMLLLFRFAVGIGVGSAPAPLGLYAEFLPPSKRGGQLVTFFTFFSIGAVLEALLAWITLGTENGGGWRALLLVSSIPSILLTFCLPIIPESPRYYLVTGQYHKALQTLQKVARINRSLESVSWEWDTVLLKPDPPPPPPPPPPAAAAADDDIAANYQLSNSINTLRTEAKLPINAESKMQQVCGECGEDNDDDDANDNGYRNLGGKISGEDDDCKPGYNGQRRTATTIAESTTIGELAKLLFSSPKQTRFVLVIGAMFFTMAALYYSIVIASNEIIAPEEGGGHGNGHKGGGRYSSGAFLEIVFTNAAELPGLALAALLLSRLGRRASVGCCFGLCGISLATILFPVVAPSARSYLIFCARASAQGFNVSLWVLATEFFPTSVRVLGVGITTACARAGSILSPFIAEFLFAQSLWYGVATCVLLALLGAIGSFGLPKDAELSLKH